MRYLAVVSVVGLLAAPAVAQPGTGNPAGMAPGTRQAAPGMPAPNQTNQNDRLFVAAATIGGNAEVALGQLAEQKGRAQAVKDFGHQMAADHGQANQRLSQLANAANIPQPGDLDEEHKAMRAQLDKLSGPEFDLAYIRAQIGDHQKTAQLFEWEIGSGQDPQLKEFAAQTLPVVLRHLQMASALQYELTAAASASTQSGSPAAPGAGSRPGAR